MQQETRSSCNAGDSAGDPGSVGWGIIPEKKARRGEMGEKQAMGVISGCSSPSLSLENHSSAIAGTSVGFPAELALKESPQPAAGSCLAGMGRPQAVPRAQGSGLERAGANMLI